MLDHQIVNTAVPLVCPFKSCCITNCRRCLKIMKLFNITMTKSIITNKISSRETANCPVRSDTTADKAVGLYTIN